MVFSEYLNFNENAEIFSTALMAQSAQIQQKCKIHLSSYNTWGIQLWSKPKVSEDRLIDCYATFEGHDF